MGNRLRFEENVPGALSSEMQKLGFTDYEAKIYIRLLRQYPATAYELSKVTGVPRANAYHALDSLLRKEAVQPVSEDPVRYVPVPPQILLEGIAGSTRQRCESLIKKLDSLSETEETQYVWTISGEAEVNERIRQMMLGAKSNVWIKASAESLRVHEEALKTLSEREVDILIILFGENVEEFQYSKSVRAFLHDGNGKVIGTADNFFTITVDHEEVLTSNVRGNVYASYTRNFPIVITSESLIRHDYYLAQIMTRFGDQIDQTYGPYLRSLRESCYSPEQITRFHKQIGVA